jgi:hypothetical protein
MIISFYVMMDGSYRLASYSICVNTFLLPVVLIYSIYASYKFKRNKIADIVR